MHREGLLQNVVWRIEEGKTTAQNPKDRRTDELARVATGTNGFRESKGKEQKYQSTTLLLSFQAAATQSKIGFSLENVQCCAVLRALKSFDCYFALIYQVGFLALRSPAPAGLRRMSVKLPCPAANASLVQSERVGSSDPV